MKNTKEEKKDKVRLAVEKLKKELLTAMEAKQSTTLATFQNWVKEEVTKEMQDIAATNVMDHERICHHDYDDEEDERHTCLMETILETVREEIETLAKELRTELDCKMENHITARHEEYDSDKIFLPFKIETVYIAAMSPCDLNEEFIIGVFSTKGAAYDAIETEMKKEWIRNRKRKMKKILVPFVCEAVVDPTETSCYPMTGINLWKK